MRLMNFGSVDAINELLNRIGMTAKLGEFLVNHLTQVLRDQHSDVVIKSVEFIKADDCSVDGERFSDGSIISVDSLGIPIDVHVALVSNNRRLELDLQVRIIAHRMGGAYDVKTDVIVQRQWESSGDEEPGETWKGS